MRSVIVDFARERLAQRRGGDALHVTLDTGVRDSVSTGEEEVLRVHEALEELAQHDEKLVRVVELRYFGGLSEAEIAESMGIHVRTVRRHWEKARLLLADALQSRIGPRPRNGTVPFAAASAYCSMEELRA